MSSEENDVSLVTPDAFTAALRHKRMMRVYNMDDNTTVIHQIDLVETGPTPTFIMAMLVRIMIYALILQAVHYAWHRVHPRSAKLFILVLLYIFPLITTKYLIFLSAVMTLFIILRLKWSKSPYLLFSNLLLLFKILHVLIVASQLALILFFVTGLPIMVPFVTFLFAVYFATLSREIVGFLSSVLHLPKAVPKNGCFVCCHELKRDAYTLACGHLFHEKCIRGWYLLAKKNYCPTCLKKIESINLSFWDDKSVAISDMLDYSRSFIIFTLFIVGYIVFVSK